MTLEEVAGVMSLLGRVTNSLQVVEQQRDTLAARVKELETQLAATEAPQS